MAYQEYGMWEILDILKRRYRKESQGHIARATGRSTKTVRRYLRKAEKYGWTGDSPPDEALAQRVAAALSPGPAPGENSVVAKKLWPHRGDIQGWLEGPEGERGLQLTKIHQLLLRRDVDVAYTSLYRYVVAQFGFRGPKRTVRRAEVAPGELAEVDFGRLGKIYDPETERNRFVWALIVTLGFSRHQYVHVGFSQKLEDLIDGLEQAWDFFDGVAERVVLDNLKQAVVRSDRYEPVFQRTFNEYAEHRGFVIDPAVVRHAQGKPIVERAVPYVRENFFRGEQWLDLAHIQRQALYWCLEIAGRRIHGTTRQRPVEVFEKTEREALRPLSGDRFDTPEWADGLKVHPDHHVMFAKALYSVPTHYLGKEVSVRGDSRLVRIFHKSKLIKTHPKKLPGQRSTDYDDYPDELQAYARRDPERMVQKASKVGPQTERFMRLLLSGTFPWSKLRQAQKLMRLAEKYGSARVESACQRALAFDLINVQRVQRIIQHALAPQPEDDPATTVVQMPLRFLRSNDSFTQSSQSKEVKRDGDSNVSENDSEATEAIGDPTHTSGEDRLRSKTKTP
jgi:transposase